MIEKSKKHLVNGGVREGAQKNGTAGTMNDFRNDLGFAGAGRPPDQMEDFAAGSPINRFTLAGV